MQSEAIIKAAIDSDQSMTSEQRERILAALEDPKPATEKMLTRKQVAALLGVHVETVKRYTRNKLLHAVKFTARAVRYSEAEVLNFMRKGVTV
ncbi:MAG: helix-turn-helix domain-containing protein [Verrucomicrobia bacterium]|nr:helix-turn-helix domain-containing protein [Verrucomicrobiota bacterium]